MTTIQRLYKILVISDYRTITSGRPEAEIFIRLAQLGHQVYILSYPEATYYNARFRSVGIKVIENHPSKKISFDYIKFLRKLVLDNKFDFVHAFNSKGLTNAVWALTGLPSKLISYRGSAAQVHWYDPIMFAKYFHPRVDHIICNDPNVEKYLASNMPWAKHKLTTIPKGHDPKWYEGVIPIDRRAFGFSPADILVCFVANLRPVKGLTWLLQATYHLPKDIPFQFLFIGKGYDEPEVKAEMDLSPFRTAFHCLGYRSDSLNIVAGCDCLVLSSTHAESITKSVIEAMFLGIAPIISAIPGNMGLMEDGQTGWIVQVKDSFSIADALTEMATNNDERKRRGKNAKAFIQKHFHIDRTVESYIRLYQRILR